MQKSILKQIITEQQKHFDDKDAFIQREILQTKTFWKLLTLDEVLVFTGIRRCGKSYTMKQVWDQVQKKWLLPSDNKLFINFDHEKMLHFRVEDFSVLMEAYFELYDINEQKPIFLFFDEIQLIKHWERFINRLYEEKKYKICITGSNAHLLSKEIGTSLTGRSINLKLFPLSFREFVNFKMKTTLQSDDMFDFKTRTTVQKLFSIYKRQGGFPQVVAQEDRTIVHEYMQHILYRDIVKRYDIRNETDLREVMSYIISNIGGIHSLKNIRAMVQSTSITTVKRYVSYLKNTFAIAEVPQHSYSIRKQIYNPDKFYVADPAIYFEIAIRSHFEESMILENIVFNELQRRHEHIFYYQASKTNKECDFVVQHKNKISTALQVTHTLTKKNKAREIDGLTSALVDYTLSNGLILLDDDIDTEEQIRNKTVHITPVWKWLLES
jgi:predicted AAA+ superfamily ATPase